MEEENFLFGGAALYHTVVDGKHCYEVGKVLTSKPSDFGRKGDKLLMINDVETQHLPPKKFVRMLSSGSPFLTMHRASIDEAEKKCPESEGMRPYHKERTVLNFSLAMVREACLDKDEENPQVPEESEWESSNMEGESFTDEEILLVSMTNTSIAIVQARGCDAQNPCGSCGGTGCTINDIVMASKQSQITSVISEAPNRNNQSQQDWTLSSSVSLCIHSGHPASVSPVCREYIKKNFERGQVLIQSLLQKSISPENIPNPRRRSACISNPTTANITIYYYISNAEKDFDKGVPVVLNFSGSTSFLKCICQNDRPALTLESCEKSKLQSICKDDPSTWPFVFYLKTTKDNHRRFESAAYSGWFIHTKPSGLVCVDQGTNYTESNFYIILHLGN
ncbi:uncharacterized protein LOC117596034 [Pangasianodon hypophthalmus]|uniref:uncharacterized protein LOC117596034 n=1 Tax=Pangasianodon hypophthalmus TaxID=310915 RepID=UPI0014800ED8|nr:uncharacterized protein LOC117596034 [Pangasianodon hypophthalmus]